VLLLARRPASPSEQRLGELRTPPWKAGNLSCPALPRADEDFEIYGEEEVGAASEGATTSGASDTEALTSEGGSQGGSDDDDLGI
jgi:hypothetical protein